MHLRLVLTTRRGRLDGLCRLAGHSLGRTLHTLGRLGGSGSLLRHLRLVLGLNIISYVCVNLVGTILLDEGGKVLDRAGAAVGDWRVLLASGVELDGGEALDFIRDVVGGGIDLGDGDLVLVRGMVSIESA